MTLLERIEEQRALAQIAVWIAEQRARDLEYTHCWYTGKPKAELCGRA